MQKRLMSKSSAVFRNQSGPDQEASKAFTFPHHRSFKVFSITIPMPIFVKICKNVRRWSD